MSGGAARNRQNLVWVPKAAEIAREAGARLREFFAQGVETEYKGDVDLVTVADRTVEKLIRERLGEAFPEHGIYGEEGTRERHGGRVPLVRRPAGRDHQLRSRISAVLRFAGPGTAHARDAPDQDGTLVAAVIYDPMRDELFTAERGQGAPLNGKPMRVSRTPDLAEALVATGFPSRKRHDESQHSLLPGVHAALARGAAGWFGRAGSGLCGLRAAWRLSGSST